MDINPLDAVLAPEPAEHTAVPPSPPPSPEASEGSEPLPEGPARGPDGKFTAKAAAPDPEAAKSQPPLSEKETVGFYKAMQEERDKRQALEKQLADLKAKAPPPADPQAPDRVQELRSRYDRLEANLNHGKDAVAEAYDWAFARCDADPVFNSRVASMIQTMGNPYEVAVALRKEADALDALLRSKESFAGQAQQPSTPRSLGEAGEPPQPPAAPSRSLADAPGTGSLGKATVIPSGIDVLGLQ